MSNFVVLSSGVGFTLNKCVKESTPCGQRIFDLPIICNNLETVQDRKLVSYGLSIGTKVGDLE